MSTVLHLGVIDFPYVAVGPAPKVAKRIAKKARVKSLGVTMTTAGVARILEDQYSVMGNFVKLHQQGIGELLAISLTETIEALAAGAPATLNPFGGALGETEQLFRTYLDDEEIAAAGQDGVPTAAAQAGVNHRLKIKRGARRPSFIDTGTYQTAFKAWIE